jgi:hypothetical protein
VAGKAARAVEAASKVWQDYSLIILSYTKHQYIYQELYNQKKSITFDDVTQEDEIPQTTD